MNMRQLSASNSDFGFDALEEFQDLLGLLGLVALVVLPEDPVGCGVDDHGLHRGGADVQADAIADIGFLYGFKQFSLTFSDTHALFRCIHQNSYCVRLSPGSLARRALPSIRLLTCRTKLAAVPATPSAVRNLIERTPQFRMLGDVGLDLIELLPVDSRPARIPPWPSPWLRRAPSARGCAR